MGISSKNKNEWEGQIISSNNFGDFKVIDYRGTNEVYIKFLDTGTECVTSLGNIKRGSVKDLYKPSVYNVGYIGQGKFTSRSNGFPQFTSYKRWKEMLGRCYDPKNPNYNNYGGRGVTVAEIWHNYQNYAQWWKDNCTDDTLVVDKDILDKNNKVYDPEKCCFIPNDLNMALTSRRHCRGDYPIGVRLKDGAIIAQINYMGAKKHLGTFPTVEKAFLAYKKAKEQCLKEYADKYKNIITKQVYDALYEYNVEITD